MIITFFGDKGGIIADDDSTDINDGSLYLSFGL